VSDYWFEMRTKLEHQDDCPCKGSLEVDAYTKCICVDPIRSIEVKDLPVPENPA
jgi:hypothetical protein